jgi:uridine kinase
MQQEGAMLVVGIAGGTASGKTTVVNRIVEALGDERVAVLPCDHYYIDLQALDLPQRKDYNFDHPEAMDQDLILDHIRSLKEGRTVRRPCYSYSMSLRTERTVPIHPAPVLIVEGILGLAMEPIRAEFDLSIYVDSADDLRLIRRIDRDVNERGRSLEETIARYLRWVRPMHEAYVWPSMGRADLIVRNYHDPEAAIRLLIMALGE